MAACGRGMLLCHGAAAHWQGTPCEMDAEEAKASSQATAAAVARMLPNKRHGDEGASVIISKSTASQRLRGARTSCCGEKAASWVAPRRRRRC